MAGHLRSPLWQRFAFCRPSTTVGSSTEARSSNPLIRNVSKTINNFSPKICYKNAVDVKNKIIISNWDLPQLEIKNIVKRLWHFVVFLRFFFVWHFVVFVGFFFVWHFVVFLDFFFYLVKFSEPKFIFLGTIFFNWLFIFIFIFLNTQLKVVSQI